MPSRKEGLLVFSKSTVSLVSTGVVGMPKGADAPAPRNNKLIHHAVIPSSKAKRFKILYQLKVVGNRRILGIIVWNVRGGAQATPRI